MVTLDWLSGGRLDFGIGVGWNKEEVEASGYKWEDRGARCDEFLEVMRRLWDRAGGRLQGQVGAIRDDADGSQADPEAAHPDHRRRLCRCSLPARGPVRAGWYGFNLDPARAKGMLEKLDAAFAKAGKKRDAKYEIVITPPDETWHPMPCRSTPHSASIAWS